MRQIVVIDDEENIQEMVRDHFELRGYKVRTASDGKEGVELCRQFKPDLVLLDLKMKKMDGEETIPKLLELYPQLKILVISAYQSEIIRKRIIQLGAAEYLEKPISIMELEKIVRELLFSV